MGEVGTNMQMIFQVSCILLLYNWCPPHCLLVKWGFSFALLHLEGKGSYYHCLSSRVGTVLYVKIALCLLTGMGM